MYHGVAVSPSSCPMSAGIGSSSCDPGKDKRLKKKEWWMDVLTFLEVNMSHINSLWATQHSLLPNTEAVYSYTRNISVCINNCLPFYINHLSMRLIKRTHKLGNEELWQIHVMGGRRFYSWRVNVIFHQQISTPPSALLWYGALPTQVLQKYCKQWSLRDKLW